MSQIQLEHTVSNTWPAAASAALRVAFGVIWAVGAALTWSPDLAVHYVGYLHNAAQGQPAWLAGWLVCDVDCCGDAARNVVHVAHARH